MIKLLQYRIGNRLVVFLKFYFNFSFSYDLIKYLIQIVVNLIYFPSF